ncbi:hypothetical protein AVEN_60366-1 [Araneus ventricosus]|uniref:Uncharacterized protein n=1 Tax=Araneus ventricosus TaxID=182803 RepID=A0A4Y2W020_ARAVE|nr:hypothetical protein AVEN_60366-1 [Araneus ventricosus]
MRLIYLSCSKWCPLQQYTSGHVTALPSAHCTTWQLTRWHKRSSCNVGEGVAYTRCLNRPECTVGYLTSCAEGRRRVGTIHSRDHSMANGLENRILRTFFSLFFRVMSH